MSRSLRSAIRSRRAVSEMIGGVIILSLLLTALAVVVFVTQEYDQYQQTVNNVAQYRNQAQSESLVADSPGLAIVTSTTIPGWGKGCTTTYNCYDLTISNIGTVGFQIVRIYVNSTASAGLGCSSPNPQPCVLNPSIGIAPYTFDQANQFVNPGVANYTVAFALPASVTLPDQTSPYPIPGNSIVIATSRGNVFSFQWPFQGVPFLPTSAFSSGNMKVAYEGTGFDSANEPSFTGKPQTNNGYCHTEMHESYPAPAGYAEELTGISSVTDSVTGQHALYFLDPWITTGNSEAVIVPSGGDGAIHSATTLYVYVIIVNTGSASYTPSSGTLDLTWYGSNHINGYLFGVYYNGGFYATSYPSIPQGAYYYAIFQIVPLSTFMDNPPWTVQSGSPSVMFWGAAAITNALTKQAGGTEQNENQGFFLGTILVSGLWLRYEASTGGCT